MIRKYAESIGIDFINHFQTYTDSQVLLGMLARVQVAYTRPYCSPPMRPGHEASMIKRYQAIPAFCTASDKSWVGPGNEASPLLCINYLFVLIKVFIVLMNIISNPQLVCTVLRYKSSCACSMDSVLSDYQNWFRETIFEAQRTLWSSQWAINGVNAMVVS